MDLVFGNGKKKNMFKKNRNVNIYLIYKLNHQG